MKNLEKVLQIRNFYTYNLVFWILLCLFELTKTYAFILFFQYEFYSRNLILWPISDYLIYWSLSFWIFDIYLNTRRKSKTAFLSIHFITAIVFSLIHKIISEIAGVMLQRLFMGQGSINFSYVINKWHTLFFDLPVSFFIYWLVILILLSLDYYKKFINEHVRFLELENKLNFAQLKTLKMQLRPHFLFNAFNTISMMIRQKKNETAIGMVSALSDMLRQSLTREPQQFVTLKEEIELVKKYLLIESERFSDRLEIHWEIDDKLLNKSVPALILQPIVENAFKHGISKFMGPSILRLSIGQDDGFIVLEVFNTAMAPLYMNISHGKGIGLSNTIDRLTKLYQSNFKVHITEKNQGISVIIRIPIDLEK